MRKHANNRITEITVYPLKITIFAEKSRTFLSVPLYVQMCYISGINLPPPSITAL